MSIWKNIGNKILKNVTESTVGKIIKTAYVYIFWQIGPIVMVTNPPVGLTTVAIGGIIFGTRLIENTVVKKVLV